jgi:Flp pilus assembly pilin Flp
MNQIIRLYTWVQSAAKQERGAGLAEYALLLFLIALASIVILGTLGGTIAGVFTAINTGLTN